MQKTMLGLLKIGVALCVRQSILTCGNATPAESSSISARIADFGFQSECNLLRVRVRAEVDGLEAVNIFEGPI